MRLFLVLILLFSTLFGNDKLLQEAKKLEDVGNYKGAMEIYKSIVQKKIEKKLNKNELRKDNFIKNNIDSVSDKKTNKTIENILSSSYGIYPYKNNYFLPISYDTKQRKGREQTEAKFQFSIKKPISYNFIGFNESINFAYTQTSWWQIYSNSSPFRETNYKPEVFMLFPFVSSDYNSLKAYKLSLLHESNGQGGENSRSWNRIYLEGYFQYSNLFFIPRIWYRIPENKDNDDNHDILDYLGYGDIKFKYIYKDQVFKLLLRNNFKLDNDNKGYAELNWSFPFFNSKDTFGFIQLSNGYGDSLIDYNKNISRVSFGISITQ